MKILDVIELDPHEIYQMLSEQEFWHSNSIIIAYIRTKVLTQDNIKTKFEIKRNLFIRLAYTFYSCELTIFNNAEGFRYIISGDVKFYNNYAEFALASYLFSVSKAGNRILN